MMKAHMQFRILKLPAVIWHLVVLLVGCAPAVGSVALTVTRPMLQPGVLTEVVTLDIGTVGVTPIVTPRGPDLVASDPSMVRLPSGQLQLVESIRIT